MVKRVTDNEILAKVIEDMGTPSAIHAYVTAAILHAITLTRADYVNDDDDPDTDVEREEIDREDLDHMLNEPECADCPTAIDHDSCAQCFSCRNKICDACVYTQDNGQVLCEDCQANLHWDEDMEEDDEEGLDDEDDEVHPERESLPSMLA